MEKSKRKNGYVYRESYYLNGHRLRSKWFRRKTDAANWKAIKVAERERFLSIGEEIIQDRSFEDVASLWLSSKSDKANRTRDQYASVLKNHLLARFNGKSMKSFNFSDGEVLKAQLLTDSKLSPRRSNLILTVFKSIFYFAEKSQMIHRNPLKGLQKINIQEEDLEYWLPAEIDRFLNSVKDSYLFPLYLVAINHGLRKSELAGLLWSAIDLDKRIITVSRSRDRYGLKETTKSRKIRRISMSDSVFRCLSNLRVTSKSLEYVFVKPNGEPVGYMHLGDREFRRHVEQAEVRSIKFKNLRTTMASNWCMSGGDIFLLSKNLGHHSVEITEKHYAHLHPSYMAANSNVVDFGLNKDCLSEHRFSVL